MKLLNRLRKVKRKLLGKRRNRGADDCSKCSPSILESKRMDEVPVTEGLRVYEATGRFKHFGDRKNIAMSEFLESKGTHLEDFRDTGSSPFRKFAPVRAVAIHNVEIEISGLPINNYRFLLGDGCLYVNEAVDGSPPRVLPAASEIHCTSISLRNSGTFYRSLELPDSLPLYLTETEVLSTPQHFSRHAPHEIDERDLEGVSVKSRITYKPFVPGIPVHKFVRIPYLDQYPEAPELIPKNRPWYQAWNREVPLRIRGFSAYFSPKALRCQHLEDIAIFAIDSNRNPISGKRVSMRDQVVGGKHHESTSLDPAFQCCDLTIEPGEFLSASFRLATGTPAADCAIFVLIEIPESKLMESFAAPLFYSRGLANLDYLTNQYDADRIRHVSTPAAKAVLTGIAASEIEPWRSLIGVRGLPQDQVEVDLLHSLASPHLFVD